MFAADRPAVGADLGRDHELVAVAARGHPLADDRLRDAHVRAHVGVGGVDEVAARLRRRRRAPRTTRRDRPSSRTRCRRGRARRRPGPCASSLRNERGRPWAPSANLKGLALCELRGRARRWSTRTRRSSRCTRTPPRRRTARRAPSCAGPRRARGRPRRRRCRAGARGRSPPPPLLLLRRLVQRDARVAHVARGVLDVLLQLLVLEDLRRRALAVAQPPVGVAGRLEGLRRCSAAGPRPR